MEITEITGSRIVLKQKTPGCIVLFMCIWSFGFSGIPLLIILIMLSGIGVTDLNCQRISSNLVNCKKNQSQFFGLLPGPSNSFKNITRAEYSSESEEDEDNDEHTNHVIKLVDNNQVKDVVFSDHDLGFDLVKMVNSTTEINNFIKSTASTFSMHQDFRLIHFIIILFPIGFASIFVLVGVFVLYQTLRSETLDFNKLSSLLIRKATTLLGEKTISSESLTNFKEIQIIESKDTDGDQWYELKLLHKSANTYNIFRSSSLPKVEQIAEKLSNFLRFPINKIIRADDQEYK